MARFYRVVHAEQPPPSDFFSAAELGVQPRGRLTAKQQEGWHAVSMYDTLEAARNLAARSPEKGTWIAAVDLPDDGSVRWEQQGRDRHHYNVWADPALLRDLVVGVERA